VSMAAATRPIEMMSTQTTKGARETGIRRNAESMRAVGPLAHATPRPNAPNKKWPAPGATRDRRMARTRRARSRARCVDVVFAVSITTQSALFVRRSGSAAGAAGPLKPEVRRSEDTVSPQSKQTGSMEDGHNLDKIGPDAIHMR